MPNGRLFRDLNENGWARLDPGSLLEAADQDAALSLFRKVFETLPGDPYCKFGTRRRRFAQFRLTPSNRHLEPIPSQYDAVTGRYYAEYFQLKSVNPDDGGRGRRFSALDAKTADDASIHKIIWNCYDLIEWCTQHQHASKIVGFHTVRYEPSRGREAVGSPNVFHQDGEPYTFAILIERKGVEGGVNYVATPTAANRRLDDVRECDILDKFILERPFEGFGVCDRMVSHYVSPLRKNPACQAGFRNVLLIDFTPAD
jgi:hypothetical protein